MKRILVGICSNRHDDRFWDSFFKFIKECPRYDISASIIKDTFLPDAQNELAKQCIMAKYDYLLLLDDDHWGHTPEMLDCLVKADTHVATIKTYSRHYPYCCVLLKKGDWNTVLPIEDGKGYVKCDLTGFPMTLIRRDTFDILKEPYFRAVEAEGRNWNTDIDFFERLSEVGVKPVGCFQHCLNHDKITQENVFKYRYQERKENNNIAWFNLLKQGV